jgi:hypothetical protein
MLWIGNGCTNSRIVHGISLVRPRGWLRQGDERGREEVALNPSLHYHTAMRFLQKRWRFWLGAYLLFGLLAISIGLILRNQSAINQANYDGIQIGMTVDEVACILERHHARWQAAAGNSGGMTVTWYDDPSWIRVEVSSERNVTSKSNHLATTWERLKWQSRLSLDKIGL